MSLADAVVTAALTKVGIIAIGAALALIVFWVAWELFLMTRKKCPDCAKGIEKSANVCPHCGYRFSPTPGAPG